MAPSVWVTRIMVNIGADTMNKNTHVYIDKLWGQEEWICNTPLYCGKILRIDPGYQCSLHMHPVKTETFYVDSGCVSLELILGKDCAPTFIKLNPGDSYTLNPGTYHRFSSLDPRGSKVIEFSTEHSDDDVIRLEDSKEIK